MAETKKGGVVKKVLISLGVFLLVFVALVFYAVTWRGSTEDIEAVANSFTPQDGWVEENYSVTPPMFICLTGRCPSAVKTWVSSRDVTYEALEKFTGLSLNNLSTDEICIKNTKESIADYCDFDGKKGGFEFRVSFEKKKDHSQSSISLFIQKDGIVNE